MSSWHGPPSLQPRCAVPREKVGKAEVQVPAPEGFFPPGRQSTCPQLASLEPQPDQPGVLPQPSLIPSPSCPEAVGVWGLSEGGLPLRDHMVGALASLQ